MRVKRSTEKQIHAYQNFNGGLNTVDANDNLSDVELSNLVNIELSERGGLRRRHGMRKFAALNDANTHNHGENKGYPNHELNWQFKKLDQYETTMMNVRDHTVFLGEAFQTNTKSQGFFTFNVQGKQHLLVAVDGKLYQIVQGMYQLLPIEGLANGFQKTLPIEAVQHYAKLFVATGTKLVEVYDDNGTVKAKTVTPYTPNALEYQFLGGNALADDPDALLQDSVGIVLDLKYIHSKYRIGIANVNNEFTAYAAIPSGATVQYKWSLKKESEADDKFKVLKDWTDGHKKLTTKMTVGTWELRLEARVKNETWIEELRIPSIKVTASDTNEKVKRHDIHKCTRILAKGEYIFLYGSSEADAKSTIFMSDIMNAYYFPVYNNIIAESSGNESITSIIPFREVLIIFTERTIQMLSGQTVEDFKRTLVNTDIGCIAPKSACAIGNYVAFLSHEGVHVLKSLQYSESRMNIEKIDFKVSNQIPRLSEAVAYFMDGQYHLVFPSQSLRFRYYSDFGVWVKDLSPYMSFIKFLNLDGELFGLESFDGLIMQFDKNRHVDFNYDYRSVIESKSYDLMLPYHFKKLKQVNVMLGHEEGEIYPRLWVYADENAVLSPAKQELYVNVNGEVIERTRVFTNIDVPKSGKFGEFELGKHHFGTKKLSVSKARISGKCRRVKIRLEFVGNVQSTLYGFSFIYKNGKV